MNIEAFLLCDCATDSQGKLNVLGAFDSIYVKQVPAVHHSCAIAARIRFSKIEQGPHKIRINVIDQDGREVAPRLEDEISVKVPDDTDSSCPTTENTESTWRSITASRALCLLTSGKCRIRIDRRYRPRYYIYRLPLLPRTHCILSAVYVIAPSINISGHPPRSAQKNRSPHRSAGPELLVQTQQFSLRLRPELLLKPGIRKLGKVTEVNLVVDRCTRVAWVFDTHA
ncbi:MAG: DUF6941 family protein [Planctomycetota bacterium]